MFDTLSQRFTKIIKTLKGEFKLTEANTQEMLREIRMALLEADVALPVVKTFIANLKEKVLGKEVAHNLSPEHFLVGLVEEELLAIMADPNSALNLNHKPPVVMLMCGLQGSGKTTTTGKLAKLLKQVHKKKVLVVSCDVYRPAAIEQLAQIAKQVEVEYFASNAQQNPLDIAKQALDYAKLHYIDVLLVDTAGRLAIDQAMMEELKIIHNYLAPQETLFVVDAMQGQDALNTAKAFHATVELSGIVLTKVDGDSRGGAALSVKHITGKPIKFMGISEKMDGIQAFDAKRVAQRMLGMGDILALVEQAKQAFNEKDAQKMAEKMTSGKFDLNDFLMHIQQMKKMGGLGNLLDKLPNELAKKASNQDIDKAEQQMRRLQGMIHSMTPKERLNPNLLKATRKRRIAAGAGVQVQDVNRLLNQFEQMQQMMKQLQGNGMMKIMKAMGGMKAIKGKLGF